MPTALHGFDYLVQGQGSHDITLNTDLNGVDTSLNGLLSQSVAGGTDVTLSAANWNNRLFRFTGTLTANINVIVPVTTRLFAVYNNTTGAFTLTVKTASGTGILIDQGSRAILACDGTNIVAYTTTLYNYSTGRFGFFTLIPSTDIGIGGQVARTLSMERHLTTNTAGNSFTDQAGGATTGATDKAGGARILKPGLGTGNAIPGLIRLQGDIASATSGTTDHTQVDRFIPNGFRVLTNNSAISIISATIASGSIIGGVLKYHIEVTNGTEFQSEVGSVFYNAVNKAGTITVTVNEVNSQQIVSAGTLSTTWALSTNNPAELSVNSSSNITPSAGYPRITFSVQNFSQQAIALV